VKCACVWGPEIVSESLACIHMHITAYACAPVMTSCGCFCVGGGWGGGSIALQFLLLGYVRV
jgi:hypothetical protein